jgi:hypothetical protein
VSDPILRRVLRSADTAGLLEALTGRLSGSQLRSLLLTVYRQRAGRITPAQLLRQHRSDRFVRPAAVRPAKQLAFDQWALSRLPQGFEAVELSPVVPLGTHSALAPVDQNHVLSTIRGTEVCADPTNALALECAARRQGLSREALASQVDLATSQRVIRAQTFAGAATFAHFRLLALCSAGRDRGDLRFEVDTMLTHLDYYLGLLGSLEPLGLRAEQPRLRLSTIEPGAERTLEERVAEPLQARHPQLRVEIGPMIDGPESYYRVARGEVWARTPAGDELHLADCGFTDWTQQLLASRKERLCTSGLGTERLLAAFALPQPSPHPE